MSLALPFAARSATAEGHDARASGLVLALVAVFLFALSTLSPAVLGDGDTWSHLATGEWMFAHGAVPRADPFSHSMPGAPWTAHEWLSEILMTLAFRCGGWSGVALLTGAAAAGAALIMGLRVARDLSGAALGVTVALGVELWTANLLARPHVLALPLAAAWTVGLLDARDRAKAPPLWFALMMILWSNMHGGFVFGLALIGPFALEAVAAAPRGARFAALSAWALFGLAAIGAALVNPYGVEALLFPFRLMGVENLSRISEWAPQDFGQLGPMEIALLLLVGFALTRPMATPPLRAALLAGLLAMALQHARHAQLLGLIGPMLLARPIAAAIGAARPAGDRRRVARAALAASLTTALAIGTLRLAAPIVRVDGLTAPISALWRRAARTPFGARPQRLPFRRLSHLVACAAVHRRPRRHVWRRHARPRPQARDRGSFDRRGDAEPVSDRLDDLFSRCRDRGDPRPRTRLAAPLCGRRRGRARARRLGAEGRSIEGRLRERGSSVRKRVSSSVPAAVVSS